MGLVGSNWHRRIVLNQTSINPKPELVGLCVPTAVVDDALNKRDQSWLVVICNNTSFVIAGNESQLTIRVAVICQTIERSDIAGNTRLRYRVISRRDLNRNSGTYRRIGDTVINKKLKVRDDIVAAVIICYLFGHSDIGEPRSLIAEKIIVVSGLNRSESHIERYSVGLSDIAKRNTIAVNTRINTGILPLPRRYRIKSQISKTPRLANINGLIGRNRARSIWCPNIVLSVSQSHSKGCGRRQIKESLHTARQRIFTFFVHIIAVVRPPKELEILRELAVPSVINVRNINLKLRLGRGNVIV